MSESSGNNGGITVPSRVRETITMLLGIKLEGRFLCMPHLGVLLRCAAHVFEGRPDKR